MKERLVARRLINIILMLFLTFAFTLAVGYLHGMYPDELLSFVWIDVIFFVLFVFVLEHSRAEKKIYGNRATNFGKITIGYALAAVLAGAGSFLPEFLRPALFVAVFLTAFCPRELALSIGLFFNTMLCLMLGGGMQELALYVLFTLFGCMLADAMETNRTQFWYDMIILCMSTMLPGIFYYLCYREVELRLFLYGVIEGIALVVFLLLFYHRLAAAKKAELLTLLEDMLDETYPLARDLAGFSRAEYQHARRVSRAAKKCAAVVGADEAVCAAAGFYYRIGIIEGDSIVENGILLAQKACFPEDVTRIISEYNGEQTLPSTVESAIVHMVDGLIKKMEVLDGQHTISSQWNKDMIIYQTLNDFSSNGIYDQSGLGMNMFLKIREYLAKEEALL